MQLSFVTQINKLKDLKHFYLIFKLLILINHLIGLSSQGYLSWRVQKQSKFKIVCYMTNWAQYRPEKFKFIPSNVDPTLCTHLIFAFAAINTTSYEIKSFEWNDESKDELIGRYEEFNKLKDANPSLRTLLAVGGWNMGSKPFSDMSKNDTLRNIFITSVVKFLRKWKFDGLDLDWEFPAKRDGSPTDDKRSFSYLVRDLRDAFYNEAMATRKEQLLLSAAVSAEQYTILKGYDIENTISHLDFLSIMSYDLHGSWEKKSHHNSPLYESPQDSSDDKRLTVDYSVRLFLTLGVPAEKLIVGIPYYGRSFTLKNKNQNTFGSETNGDGKPGESTRESGFLSYFEICKYLKSDNWTRGWSKDHQVPYAYKDTQWVGYDDEESIQIKVDYVSKYCLGGAMVWSIDLDDFKGVCSNKTLPLTKLISSNLKDKDRKKCSQLPRISNDKDIDQYLKEIVKWTPSSSELIEDKEDDFAATTTFLAITTTNKTSPTTTKAKTTPSKRPIATSFPKATKSSMTSATKYFFLTNFYEATTKKSVDLSPSNNKNPIYEIENKQPQERLNELMISAYQNNIHKNNSSILDQLFQQFLSNMTKAKMIDEANININSYRQVNNAFYRSFNNMNANNNNDNNNNKFFKNSNFFHNKEANVKQMLINENDQFFFNYKPPTKQPVSSSDSTALTTSLATKSTAKEILKNNFGCENLSDGEFVRDPNDCSSFYTCLLGKATKKTTCDTGLMFDSKLRVCNWKANVICTSIEP